MDRMIYEQELIIAPSITDADGKLGYANAFGVCMDIAAIHAESLGLGLYDLSRRNLFWITVKTQLRFLERPQMMERVLVRTWPEQPGKLRGNRSYQILRGDSILISGKTEWAVMNTKTGQLSPMVDVYPVDMIFPTIMSSSVAGTNSIKSLAKCNSLTRAASSAVSFFANGFTHFSRLAIFIKIGFVLFVAITLLCVSIITIN